MWACDDCGTRTWDVYEEQRVLKSCKVLWLSFQRATMENWIPGYNFDKIGIFPHTLILRELPELH